MGVLADEYVRVRADTSHMGRDLKRQGAEHGKSFGGAFSGALKAVFAGAAVIGAAKVLGGALKAAVIGASDLNETINKSNVIFGKNAGVINKWAGTAATSLGLSRQEAIAAAASFGDMFMQIGFSDKAATRMSKSTVQLAADLGSFNNLPTADVQERIAAAFRGEYDSLQKVIPNINAARVQQVALNETGKESATQLTAQEKAHAVLSIIQKDGKRAAGDFARTQGDVANQAKTAKAQLKNMSDQIGTAFLPALKDVFNYITVTVIPAFQDFFDNLAKDKELKTAVQNLKDALVTLTGDADFKATLDGIAAALPPIVQGLADVVTKYHEISTAIDKFENASFGGADSEGGPVGWLIKTFKAGGTIEVALIHFRTAAVAHVKAAWAAVKAAFAADIADIVAKVSGFDTRVTQAIAGMRDKVVAYVKQMWADIAGWFARSFSYQESGLKQWVDRIVGWFSNMKGRVVAWVKSLWADARASFVANHSAILAQVTGFVGRIAAWFGNMKTRVVAWVKTMWSEAKASFIANHAFIGTAVSGFVTRITGFFTNLKTRVVSTASSMMTTVRQGIDRGLTAVRTAFNTAVNAVKTIWDKMKAIARTPVAFVVNTVIEGGLLAAVRAVSKFVGFKPGQNIHVSMASGGILPGYTPGKDVHRFYSPTGGTIDLSGGEGIARPELARAIGKKRWDAANNEAMHGRISKAVGYLGGYFLGGLAPVPGTGRKHSGYPWATWAGDFPNPTGTPVHAWASGRVAAVKNWNYSYGRHVRINHPGNKQTLYAHLQRAIVSVGQAIGRGNTLGYVDSTGNSTGPHLHFELKGGQGVLGGANGPGAIQPLLDAAKYISQVTGALGRLKEISGTPLGQMVSAAARLIGDKVKDKITSLVDKFNSANAASGAGFTAASGGSNRAIGHKMMLQRWGESQWPPLNSLWTKESGWRTTARNPSSGAYGIPQSLPASKMASAGSDWRTNPATQIKWGLGYIAGRYGTPAAAWAHSQRTNWYGMGGVIREPVMGFGLHSGQRYGFGEHGPETVTPGRRGNSLDARLDRLIAVLEARGNEGLSLDLQVDVNTDEPRSIRLNRNLQKVGGGVGLVN